MDGDFRSQAAWMPPWLRPDRIETSTHILLVKSDSERRLEKIGCAATCAEPSNPQAALLYLQAELLRVWRIELLYDYSLRLSLFAIHQIANLPDVAATGNPPGAMSHWLAI